MRSLHLLYTSYPNVSWPQSQLHFLQALLEYDCAMGSDACVHPYRMDIHSILNLFSVTADRDVHFHMDSEYLIHYR